MSSTMFWAADSLAQSISGARERAAANSTLRKQQGYHAGDIGVKRCAIEALRAIAPDHPILIDSVSDRIYSLGERTFYKSGWAAACAIKIDPAQVLSKIQAEFEESRVAAILKTEKESIKKRRRGWVLINRRTVWAWRKSEHPIEIDALAAKEEELQRLNTAKLGDRL